MADVQDILSLSPLQEGILFHSLYAPGNGVYVEQRWCVVEGELDTAAFQLAWNHVINRHQALRAEFHWEETKEPVQVIYDEVELEWQLSLDGSFEEFLAEDRKRGFELDRAPLIRFALFTYEEGSSRFVWTFHHLLMDGWANGVLIGEVFTCYEAYKKGQPPVLPDSVPYRRFLDWHEARPREEEESYWRKTLGGFFEPSLLSIGEREVGEGYEVLESSCTAVQTEALEVFARDARLTVNTLVQGAWSLLLASYTKQKDLLFGVTVSGRPPEVEGIERAIGLFMNSVPVRVSIEDKMLTSDFLESLQVGQREREQFGYGKLLDLQSYTDVPGGLPLFESLIVFENYPISMDEALADPKSDLRWLERKGYERTNYPLTIVVIPGETLHMSFRYEKSSFSNAFMKRLFPQFVACLEGLMIAKRLGEISFLSEEERGRLDAWGQGEVRDSSDESFLKGFQKCVKSNSSQGAVVTEDGVLTYGSLDEESGKLATYLKITYGVTRGTRVGIYLERKETLLIALLAVWKCGAAYVPLDRDFPEERLSFMGKDADLTLLLHEDDDEVSEVFPEVSRWAFSRELYVNEEGMAEEICSSDAAYLIYTSGSTGQPKGVVLTHGNLMNFLNAMDLSIGLSREDVLLAVTTISFDISLLELFWPLVNGASLVLAPSQSGRDGEVIRELVAANDVTIMQATPVTWRVLLEDGDLPLKRVLCGGEALDFDLAERLVAQSVELWNLYGPTETTIWSSVIRLTSENLVGGVVPLGGPILNTTLEVRGLNGRLVPQGAIGELWIGGDGVSLGYWKRPELTAKNFREDRYATGDLVAWREDGLLDFKGRLDGQVKLRGFRIEVGDIESNLLSHELVEEAVVVLQEEEESRLIAFVRLSGDVSEKVLLEESCKGLPPYMVPTRVVRVEEFPLTPNRKFDRKALSERKVESARRQMESGFDRPEEELVAGIWTEILGAKVVSREDHFFESGGHSLAATRVVGRVRDILGVKATLKQLFENPRLGDFVRTFEEGEKALVKIPRWNDVGKMPLSSAQRRQWLMEELSSGNAIYAVPSAVRIRGDLSISRLTGAWQEVVDRHEGLRLVFDKDDFQEPYGRVLSGIVAEIEVRDQWEGSWEEVVKEIAGEIFDLSRGPLWQVNLFKLSENEYLLFFNFHHILVDGWSLGLLVKDLIANYLGEELLAENDLRYVDYAVWQNARDWSEGLEFWKENLRGLPVELPLPLDFPRPAEISHAGRNYDFEVDADVRCALVELGQEEGTTLFMTLAVAFVVLLHRYGSGEDIALGTPVANRLQKEVEPVMGLFMNTLVLRSQLQGNPTLGELLSQMREQTLAAFQHQEVPFDEVVEALDVPRSRELSPLFQVLFTLQNAPLENTKVDGLEWEPISLDTGTSKFDLSLAMHETEDGLVGRLEYRSDLFLPETIQQMAGDLEKLLERLPEMVDFPLSGLNNLGRDSQEALLEIGRGQGARRRMTIPECFRQQVEGRGGAPALKSDGNILTYRELDNLSKEYARELSIRGVGFETRVGVMAVRSPETIAALLAILRVGATYVPLEIGLPESRLNWVVEDAELAMIFSDEASLLKSRFPDLEYEEIGSSAFLLKTGKESGRSPSLVDENQLAYLLYTSGSTGVPKGVLTPHLGVVRLVKENDFAHWGANEVFLQAAPLGFDASTFEIWGALLNGCCLVLAGRDTPSLGDLAGLVQAEGVTTMWLTAGLFHLAVDEEIQEFAGLKQLLAGGDVLSPDHLRRATELWPKTQLINGYGPTETTTFACCHQFGNGELSQGMRAPIGRPVGETEIYLLDQNMNLVPRGVVGDLYIGGGGLARGYLNQAAFTAENFIPNPFFDPRKDESSDQKLTLYRSGDRARWRHDEILEFLGRGDEQVKIRGFRVEPGEVKNALLGYPGVKDAAVQVWVDNGGHKRLVAYVVGGCDDLKAYLGGFIPPPLVPSQFVFLESLPLTDNGKLDVRALPEPDWETEIKNDQVGSLLEEKVRAVWQEVLPCEAVGLQDNFFELGGDSILALQIISRLKRVGLRVSPAELFQYQTVTELALVIREDRVELPKELVEGNGEKFAPPPIQSWFRKLSLANPHHFNQATCLRSVVSLDHRALDLSLNAIFSHHDALRLRWRGDALQICEGEVIQIIWVDERDFFARVETAQGGLHLEDGPLLQVIGCDENTGKTRLCFIAHHCVIDVVSWQILLDDFQEVYRQALIQKEIRFAAKTVHYQVWSSALQDTLSKAKEARDYWQDLVNGAKYLSFGLQRGAGGTGRMEFQMSRDMVELSELLAALGKALGEWGEQDEVSVMLESHGRNSDLLGSEYDMSRSVGWFTSIYPMTLKKLLGSDLSLVKSGVEKELKKTPHGGMSYGVLLYLDGEESLELSPSVGFNFLGRIDDSLNESGFERMAAPGDAIAVENDLTNPLMINCWIEDGDFKGEWAYDRALIGEAEVGGVMNRFVDLLNEKESVGGEAFGLDASVLASIKGQVDFGGTRDE